MVNNICLYLQFPYVVAQHDHAVTFEELLENVHQDLYEQNHDEQIHYNNDMDKLNQKDTIKRKINNL